MELLSLALTIISLSAGIFFVLTTILGLCLGIFMLFRRVFYGKRNAPADTFEKPD